MDGTLTTMMIRTWHAEMAVATTVLAAVVVVTGRYASPVEWIGAGAVLLTFGHMQVSDRLAENAAFSAKVGIGGGITVDCFKWTSRYLVGKEILWLVYFMLHQSWSALAGVGLFLLYPVWREWWRS